MTGARAVIGFSASGLLAALLATGAATAVPGCGSEGEDEGSAASDPEEFCPDECARRVATDCGLSEDDQPQCELLCRARYTIYSDCSAELQAYDACSRDRITYVCDSGAFGARPQGACAESGMECLLCTGDMLGCGF